MIKIKMLNPAFVIKLKKLYFISNYLIKHEHQRIMYLLFDWNRIKVFVEFFLVFLYVADGRYQLR